MIHLRIRRRPQTVADCGTVVGASLVCKRGNDCLRRRNNITMSAGVASMGDQASVDLVPAAVDTIERHARPPLASAPQEPGHAHIVYGDIGDVGPLSAPIGT